MIKSDQDWDGFLSQTYKQWRKEMIALADGTVLEKEYKGRKIKVVVKKGKYAFDGKLYAKRGALMKAVTKGKVAQFTNFFGLAKEEETNGEAKPKRVKKSIEAAASVTVEEGTIEGIIRRIVREEIKKSFQDIDL